MTPVRFTAACLLALSTLAIPASAQDEFYAVTLGTGIPLPNPQRASAATLVVAGETTILIDTGRAFLSRLVAEGHQDVSMVLFTHFHSDHIADFGELMVNRGIAGSENPLPVYGPKETKEVVDGLLAGFAKDAQYREDHHHEHWPDDAMTADVTECEPGVIYEKDGLKITMFEVDHRPIEPAVGYRIDYNGQAIVISGDTIKVDAMIEYSKGADILIHEAMNTTILNVALTGLRNGNPRQAAMLEDLMEYHTSTIECAEIARDAGVKKLVLTHLVPSIPPNDAAETNFVRGMSEIFDGEIITARDGMKITP